MKTTGIFGLILLMVLVAACVPANQKTDEISAPTEVPAIEETVPPTEKAGVSEQALQNMSYHSPLLGRTIQLIEGVYSEDSMMAALLPEIAIGDLNEDKVADAAVLLAENSGGTGTFVSLVVFVSSEGNFEQVGSIQIDDRPVIESLLLEDGFIKLSAVVHGINDPISSPTLKVKQTYKLLENNLLLMRQTSTIQGGTERIIVIDTPQRGSEVSGYVRIVGSMPTAPFENNLRLRILDQTGKELFISGFMVTSEDMGTPAVFDNEITLPDLPSGTWVKLELSDISMADGSVISMNSVLVKIK